MSFCYFFIYDFIIFFTKSVSAYTFRLYMVIIRKIFCFLLIYNNKNNIYVFREFIYKFCIFNKQIFLFVFRFSNKVTVNKLIKLAVSIFINFNKSVIIYFFKFKTVLYGFIYNLLLPYCFFRFYRCFCISLFHSSPHIRMFNMLPTIFMLPI